MHSALKGIPGSGHSGPFPGFHHHMSGLNGYGGGMPMMGSGFAGPMYGQQQHMGGPYRQMPGLGMHMFPGMNGGGMPPIPQGRGFPNHGAPPGFPQQLPNGNAPGMTHQPFSVPREAAPPPSHSRQPSTSFEKSAEAQVAPPQTAPIARPAPIGRPASVVHGHRRGEHKESANSEVDDLSNHLGSSALLDDSDEPFPFDSGAAARRASVAPGNVARQAFSPATSFGLDHPAFASPPSYPNWGAVNPFGTSSLPGAPTWSTSAPGVNSGWGGAPAASFGALGARNLGSRSVAVRKLLCDACKVLDVTTKAGFHELGSIRDQVERLNIHREEPVSERELLDICDTEGNATNGGGYFDVQTDSNGRTTIKHQTEAPSNGRPVGAPGEIGSPIVGGAMPAIMSRNSGTWE